MDAVTLLWHVSGPSDREDELLIGVYRSTEDAHAAIERLKTKPGFADTPDGFHTARYELNVDHWTEGFRRDP